MSTRKRPDEGRGVDDTVTPVTVSLTATTRPRKKSVLEQWKRRRAAKRLRRGDGRPLQPFRWWHLLTERALLRLRLVDRDGRDVAPGRGA